LLVRFSVDRSHSHSATTKGYRLVFDGAGPPPDLTPSAPDADSLSAEEFPEIDEAVLDDAGRGAAACDVTATVPDEQPTIVATTAVKSKRTAMTCFKLRTLKQSFSDPLSLL
jgi:hypothetical protein